LAYTHPPTHVFFPSTRRVDFKSTGWCWDQHLRRLVRRWQLQQRRPHQAKPTCHETAQFRVSTVHDQARQTRMSRASGITFFHIKILPRSLHTSKFVCVRLLVATAIWRTVIHCLLYDNTTYTVCWPGVEFPPLHIYLSVIRQRPLHYLIYYSDC